MSSWFSSPLFILYIIEYEYARVCNVEKKKEKTAKISRIVEHVSFFSQILWFYEIFHGSTIFLCLIIFIVKRKLFAATAYTIGGLYKHSSNVFYLRYVWYLAYHTIETETSQIFGVIQIQQTQMINLK